MGSHEKGYAIDPTKIHNELGWLPETKFEDSVKKTIEWYLKHKSWWEEIISGEYQKYYERMYGEAHRHNLHNTGDLQREREAHS